MNNFHCNENNELFSINLLEAVRINLGEVNATDYIKLHQKIRLYNFNRQLKTHY